MCMRPRCSRWGGAEHPDLAGLPAGHLGSVRALGGRGTGYRVLPADLHAAPVLRETGQHHLCGPHQLQNLMISKSKILGVMEEPEESGSMEPFQTDTHEITFDHVDFAYVPGEPVLKQATFTVPDQKLTAIVGTPAPAVHHPEPDRQIL